MASDGCQTPTWTGSAFSYLMHQPTSGTSPYRGTSSLPAPKAARSLQSAAGEQAATGVWDGPAPRTQLKDADNGAPTSGIALESAASVEEQQPDAVSLPGGGRMPLIGFGTYKVESSSVISAALEAGYRHLDCAAAYGNEAAVGAAIAPWIAEHGRDSLFLCTKIWNTSHRPELVRQSATQSLIDLGVDKLDLLLMHWPDAWTPSSSFENPTPDSKVTVSKTWAAMEKLVDEGMAASIGVSNFSERALRELMAAARIKPVVNQIELHPLLSQRRLVGACLRMGVVCVAYSPLGHGKDDILVLPAVAALAESLKRTPAQVVLRWNLQRGVAVLPKASSAAHVRENIAGLFDWRLSYNQKATLDALDEGRRFVDFPWHDWNA